jgi:catechol 2,3-dioxygenase-like lactoylglutathione lyase family enzyme
MGERSVPILPSRNLRESLSFYERLGFENRGPLPEQWEYLIIGRGGIELRFYADPHVDSLMTSASCYAHVDDAQALYDEWGKVVVADAPTGSRLVGPVDTDYGTREFAVVDRSGNLLRIGSPLTQYPPLPTLPSHRRDDEVRHLRTLKKARLPIPRFTQRSQLRSYRRQ